MLQCQMQIKFDYISEHMPNVFPYSFISVAKIQNCAAQFLCIYSVTVDLTSNLTAWEE